MEDKRIKVLLVEDNPADAGLLRAVLKSPVTARFEMTHVIRLRDALSCLSTEPFDVVLLDLLLKSKLFGVC